MDITWRAKLLLFLDPVPWLPRLIRLLRSAHVKDVPTSVGGLRLSHSLIMGAGLVKGKGFADEGEAMRAVESGETVIRGMQIVPALLGPIEIGSFTRYPRLGNSGTWLARRIETRSTQNRMGLPNPGARAAARFLSMRRERLPAEFGINIAPSPGVHEIDHRTREVCESLAFFLDADVKPMWFTLNLSCPNTEDDPLGKQLEAEARRICGDVLAVLRPAQGGYPALGEAQSGVGRGALPHTDAYFWRAWRSRGRRYQHTGSTDGDGSRFAGRRRRRRFARRRAGNRAPFARRQNQTRLRCRYCGLRRHPGWRKLARLPRGWRSRRAILVGAGLSRTPSPPPSSKASCAPRQADMKQSIASALLEIGAVGFSPDAPLTFKSGIRSPVYVDNRRLTFHPAAWRGVIKASPRSLNRGGCNSTRWRAWRLAESRIAPLSRG